jgi:predicted TIM-barrel fold metal-dependent hydrolase
MMCANHSTCFSDHHELARLPYFRLEDGRLKLADPGLGPTIDFHTHLTLSYVRKNRVDLHKLHPRTELYLQPERPLDLERYQNQNFSAADLKRLKTDLTLKSVTAGGMRATHTAANLARDMDDLGIRHSVLLPIDFPWLSDNARTWREAVAGDPRFICYGSVHPFASKAEDRLGAQHAAGAAGIKLHPNIQIVAPEGRRSMALYDQCASLGMVVFWHCGPVGIEPPHGKWLTQVRRYEKPIRELRRCTFVLGHAGALQADEALELARRHDNVYLELSGQSLSSIKRMLDRGPTDRILFGTDWPWYHQAIGLAKVYLATEGREDLRRKVLYDNAARLLGLGAPAVTVPARPGVAQSLRH